MKNTKNKNRVVSSALQFIANQVASVKKLSGVVQSKPFKDAIRNISACKGRIVVSGMGKAGIIGQKISATLSSVGTPSLWMHPADAVHGDLGMVTSDDIIVILSQSGQTEEIIRLLPLLKQIGSFVISITGNPRSTLSKYSDIVIDTLVRQEACPLGLAPTTSTIAMLAIGDALAISVLQVKGFKKEDYAFFHPGGGIGKGFLQVKDIMRKGNENPFVFPDCKIKDAMLKITKARAGCVSVIDKRGKLIGLFTDGDLRRKIETDMDLLNKSIDSVMTKNPKFIEDFNIAQEGLRKLRQWKIDELPVIDKRKKLVGLLDIQDLLKAGIVIREDN